MGDFHTDEFLDLYRRLENAAESVVGSGRGSSVFSWKSIGILLPTVIRLRAFARCGIFLAMSRSLAESMRSIRMKVWLKVCARCWSWWKIRRACACI